MITCDICKGTGKGRYRTVELEVAEGKGKLVTACYECLSGKPRPGKSNRELFNELQTPFWKIMGLKPTEKDLKLEKYLKHRGIGYGDWRLEREYKQAKHESAIKQFESHYKHYGRNNAPDPSFQKDR